MRRTYLKNSAVMVALHAIFVVLLCAVAAVTTEKLNPLSDEFINLINSKQNSWKAGRNFPVHTPFSYIKNLMGALKDENSTKLPKVKHDAELIANLPESFDPRDKWPNCPSLNEIRDQGSCGSCWAFGAVEAMTDRYCIYSNGTQNFHFSAQDVVSCCQDCGHGCHGGLHVQAWTYWQNTGIVSGGNYNSSQGCKPYEIAFCEHHVPGKLPPCGEIVETPKCVNSCQPNYNTDYDKDKRRGKNVVIIHSDEEQTKAELFKNGPVSAQFSVYEDFLTYREGVYKHVVGGYVAGHVVKMLGWGIENGEKYWLMANSWNPDWGDKGYFKILRGHDQCGIESLIVAGEPLIE